MSKFKNSYKVYNGKALKNIIENVLLKTNLFLIHYCSNLSSYI